MQQAFAIASAAKKIANLAVDRMDHDIRLVRHALQGEQHRFFTPFGCGVRFVAFGAAASWFGHARCLTDDETSTICNTRLSHAKTHDSHALMPSAPQPQQT